MFNTDTTTLNITAELLGLPHVAVTDIRVDRSIRKIIIKVKSTEEIIPCRECGKPTQGHGLGRPLQFRHLPILGQETIIEITPRRGRCEHCDGNPTTTEKSEWYTEKSKFTKAYEQHLLFELVNSTMADVSRKADVDYHLIEDLVNRYIETEIDYSTIKALGVLGIDEISLKKGYQDFVTLITYRIHEKVHILGIVKGREKAGITAFLSKIPQVLHKTIQAVCCDLYDGYMNACKAVFKDTIPIIADRFHVRKLYGKSLIQLRKAELKRLKKELTPEAYAALKPAIALLRKLKDYFTEEEKPIVETLFSLSPKLKLAYQFSRDLSGLFDSHITPEEAKEKMTEWIDQVSHSKLKCFNQFIKTLVKYQEPISHYFRFWCKL